MPLSIEDSDDGSARERGAELPRICPLCQQVNETDVCAGCGVDLVTGDLVHVPSAPAWRPDVERLRQRRRAARRTPADLIQAALSESLRGWFGTVVAMLWMVPVWVVHVPALIAYFCACLMADRSRAALGSAVVLVDPAAFEPDEDERPPLGRRDLAIAAAQALGATLLLSPLVSALLTSDRLDSLQSAGFLTLASGTAMARVLALATVFVAVATVALALRARPGRAAVARGDGAKPFDLLELLGCLPKGCLLMFPLLALATWPATLLVAVPLLPLVVGALASGWEDLSPAALWHALRTTPGYGVTVLLSTPPMVLLTLCMAQRGLGLELAVPTTVLSASWLGVLAGIARQDCEANQRAADDADDADDPRGADA